jgi:hypothetical protein
MPRLWRPALALVQADRLELNADRCTAPWDGGSARPSAE